MEWKANWQIGTLDYNADVSVGWGVDLKTTIKQLNIGVHMEGRVGYSNWRSYESDTINYGINTGKYVYWKVGVNVWNTELFMDYKGYGKENRAWNTWYGTIWIDYHF